MIKLDPRGHHDYPHFDGQLPGCPECDVLIEAQEREEQLAAMAEVYMTDPGCKAAVERLRAKDDALTLVQAAQLAARSVPPAPHNFAAHDARYLLAPEVEANDTVLLNTHIQPDRVVGVEAFDEQARWERQQDASVEQNDGSGPMPPHPDEAREDRRPYTRFAELEREEADILLGGHVERHECGALCKALSTLAHTLYEDERIPVAPPVLEVTPFGESGQQRVRITVETIPARRRAARMTVLCGQSEDVDQGIQETAMVADENPSWRLVVRRDPAFPWASVVIYIPRIEVEQARARQEVPTSFILVGPEGITFGGEDGSPADFQEFLAGLQEFLEGRFLS